MYTWIWRHLPYGLHGKIIGSLLLFGAAVSLLWFWVFPATAGWVEEFLLPFDQSTIETGPTDGNNPDPAGEFVGPTGQPTGGSAGESPGEG
jgi:hypothetical protein